MTKDKISMDGYSFICEGNMDISGKDVFDMLGLSRAIKGRIEEYVPPPPESEHLSAEVYTASCDICGGRSRAEVDHLEDLVQRCALTNSPHPTFFLHKHWPYFADFNRLMQFHCMLCKLHFRGARTFVSHLYRCQMKVATNGDSEEPHLAPDHQEEAPQLEHDDPASPSEIQQEKSVEQKKEPEGGESDTVATQKVDEDEEETARDYCKQEEVEHEAAFDCPTDGEGKDFTDIGEADLSAVEEEKPDKGSAHHSEEGGHQNPSQDAVFSGRRNHMVRLSATEKREKHSELLQQFIDFLKEVCDKPPTPEMLPKLRPFLCEHGPQVYEAAFLRGSYEPPPAGTDESTGHYDTSSVDFMQLTRALLLARGSSTETCEPTQHHKERKQENECEEEVTKQANCEATPLKSFYGPLASRMRMSQVLMNRLDELQPRKCMEQLVLSDREFRDQHYDNPFRADISKRTAIMKCMCCDEAIHSVRHHIQEVLWHHWPTNSKFLKLIQGKKEPTDLPLSMATPWSHLNHLLRLTGHRNPLYQQTTVYCPVCGLHFSNSRGFYFLIYHLRIHVGMTRGDGETVGWPSDFIMRHVHLMVEFTEILVARMVGDISVKHATNLMIEKFSCPHGGSYRGPPAPAIAPVKSKAPGVNPNKAVKVQPQRGGRGGGAVGSQRGVKRTMGDDYRQNPSVGPPQKWGRTSGSNIMLANPNGPSNLPNRPLLSAASSGGSFGGGGGPLRGFKKSGEGRSLIPRMEMSSWGGPVAAGPQNISRMPPVPFIRDSLISMPFRRDRAVMCELCNTPVEGEHGLQMHLLQSLFRMRSRPDGHRIAERHLMCFPGVFVYRLRAVCPACSASMQSFDACMAHVNLAPGEHHRQLERDIVALYIDCMTHRINLDNVMSFLKSRFCIRE